MDIAIFYLLTCCVMAVSTWIGGLQWSGATGVNEFLHLVFVQRPVILVGTISLFLISGVHMHVGKAYFNISYFENSIIWLSTSWVSFLVLWLAYDMKPSMWELTGIIFGQIGLFIACIGKAMHSS